LLSTVETDDSAEARVEASTTEVVEVTAEAGGGLFITSSYITTVLLLMTG
jgi:hypothetical protein